MRNTIRVLLAAGVLVAGACGDDDDSDAGGGGGDFCDRAAALLEEESASTDFSLESFEQLRETMADMDPPAEIADDWQASIDAMNTLAQQEDVEQLDQSDPEVAEALEQVATSGMNIDAFISEECGVDVDQ